LTDKLLSWMKMSSVHAMAGALEASTLRLAYRDENQAYPVPILIVTGARDRAMPVSRQAGQVISIRHQVHVAGHLVNLETSAEVNRLLLGFLQTLNTIKLHHHRLQKVA
jgi:pimeloyl-ACP methyl ester carboxylesterase